MNDNKLKIVTFFTNEIKMNIYLILFTTVTYAINRKFPTTPCTKGYLSQMILIFIGSILLSLLNLISMVYLVAKKHFARTEFFLIWIVNILWFITNVSMSINSIHATKQCSPMNILNIIVILTFMKNIVEILCIVFMPVDFTNRQLSSCTNQVFTGLFGYTAFYTTPCYSDQTNFNILIFATHLLFALFFAFLNSVALIRKWRKKVNKARLFLQFMMGLILVILWIVVIIQYKDKQMIINPRCVRLRIIWYSYMIINPISLCFMVFFSLVRYFKNREEKKNVFEKDLEQIDHIQIEDEQSSYQDSRNDINAKIKENDQIYGSIK